MPTEMYVVFSDAIKCPATVRTSSSLDVATEHAAISDVVCVPHLAMLDESNQVLCE
jgi:hypothetical protein